jgi:hypothetical protein
VLIEDDLRTPNIDQPRLEVLFKEITQLIKDIEIKSIAYKNDLFINKIVALLRRILNSNT